jgi:hypothetical protein
VRLRSPPLCRDRCFGLLAGRVAWSRLMKIDIVYDSSVTSGNFTSGAAEEAAFKSAITYVVDEFESLYTNPVTIKLNVGWGQYDGKALDSGDIGENVPSQLFGYSYATIKSALLSTAKASGDPAQVAAYATLPAKDPTGGDGFVLSPAQAMALGLPGPTGSGTDGYIGFLNDTQFEKEYGTDWNFSQNVTSGEDFVGLAEHEISEELGRGSLLGANLTTTNSGTFTSAYSIMDLFRYTSAGGTVERDLTPGGKGSTAYFSYDKGTTNLGTWEQPPQHRRFG